MENSMEVSQKAKNKLPYDPAIPHLGIYLKKMETLIQKGTCTTIFIAALLILAKIWKQPKHQQMNE